MVFTICLLKLSVGDSLVFFGRSKTQINMAYSKVTHVIFDMDGLLLDTEIVYKASIEQYLATFGKVYTWELRDMVMGTVEQDTAKILVNELNLPISPDEFRVQLKEYQRDGLCAAQLMPGAERLVRHLSKNGVPIAVATSSGAESVQWKTAKHKELFSLFHHIVSGSTDEEVKHGKPAPDVFLVCASRFPDKPANEKCLVFEDAPNGVLGARCAGMQVVMVPDDKVPEEKKKPATLVLQSLLDFKPELFGLPAFDN